MSLRRLAPLFVATGLLASAAPAGAQEPTPLVVVELATVQAAPDTATVAGEITRRAFSAALARRRVERRVAIVLANLDALGVPRADVRTNSVRSHPSRRHGRILHYASTSLQVRTMDLAKLGRILAAFGGASIDGPQFEVSDSTAAREEATRTALQRARRRADAAAAALGLRVLAIRKVDLNPEFGFDASLKRGQGGSSASSPESQDIAVEPGREQVSVAVAVVYDIGA